MIRPLLAGIGATPAFTRLAPHVLPRCDLAFHRLTGGRWTPSRLVLPVLVLTTTGRRTGRPRTTPVCAYHDEAAGSWLVIGSNFGRPEHPAWSGNLLHTPRALAAWQGRPPVAVTARLLTPGEQEAERGHILRALPVYDHYAARAGSRGIRVFRLTRPESPYARDSTRRTAPRPAVRCRGRSPSDS
ncbi:nitroreductase family deazaflavin-dependent oxidoreductase [Streptomyces lycii]|uniref:Nitroreductase family deazaflavin-dependent oxidoreductase n=1 Tax=Streptomyces lycii TaxID=2654337 RepID=A0ABQ7FI39_9ACTN|nr:nitroreductase family deazaflavin-dependent oxidoreductase [Streptomyces lycii]KAF4408495.1 nitroreductase family deazaflavin-dependent oxidoreductase [Streptomyces lycii]